MANWTGSFHAPKFTDDQFEKQKDAYNRKNGYTVTVPALDDIIHLAPMMPITDDEAAKWTSGKKEEIPKTRRAEIQEYKNKKKQKYLNMLASPSPKIVRSAGAILTSLDDFQDCISTLACIGLITAAVVGGTTAAVLSGPLGWIVGVTTLMSMINPYSRLRGRKGRPYTGRAAKKNLEQLTDKNPFSQKARARYAKNITKFRPSIGNAIEALQVTDQVFGVGVCLGPIMGFAQDLIAGGVRKLAGEDVHFQGPDTYTPKHVTKAARALKSSTAFNGFPWSSDFMDEVGSFIAPNLALQVMHPYIQGRNPFRDVDRLAAAEVLAPRPTDIITLELIKESGADIEDVCNWPQSGSAWMSYGDLADATAAQATANLNYFAERHKNSPLALLAAQNARDFALGVLGCIEGDDQVQIEFLSTSRIVIMILDNGWCYPDDITDAQVEKFEDWCRVHEYMNTVPTAKDIKSYAEIFCGFSWAKSDDTYR